MATTTWTTIHPIPWRNTSFTWLPYWIFDIIVEMNKEGEDWRDYAEEKYAVYFDTLKEAYTEYGDVDFIESRNGYVYKLSDFTPDAPAVTIAPKSPVPAFKVGDADLAASALFDIDPSNTTVVLSIESGTAGSIVSNKLHAVEAGNVTVKCAAGSVSATVVVAVGAQPVTIVAKSSAPAFAVGDADLEASELFDITPSDTAVVLTVESGTAATIVGNKLHAAEAGDVTVQCAAGSVLDTITVTVTAAP